jgi:hypothetical protein
VDSKATLHSRSPWVHKIDRILPRTETNINNPKKLSCGVLAGLCQCRALEFTHEIHPESVQQISCVSAPAELRGSVFGIFNPTRGISMLLASFVAVFLWQVSGPGATFISGTILPHLRQSVA